MTELLPWLVLSVRIVVALAIIGVALQLPRLATVAIAISGFLLCAPLAELPRLTMSSNAQLLLGLGRELALGATLGLVASLPLWAVKAAGAAIDAHLGSLGPINAEASHRRYYQLFWSLSAAMVFFASNGLALVAGALTRSYQTLPLATAAVQTSDSVATLASTTVAGLGAIFSLALPLAMPLLLTVMALMVAGHVSGRIAGQRSAWTVVTGAMPLAVVVAVAALYGVSSHYITQIVVAALA